MIRTRANAPRLRATPPTVLGALVLSLGLAGCGGGGGGDAPAGGVPDVTLAATPATLSLGNRATLAWEAIDATECVASGDWSGPRATEGTETTPILQAPASYTLECTGPGGTDSATTDVAIAPPTVTLVASPASVIAGQTATLTWTANGAASCSAEGGWAGSRPLAGTAGTGPLASTTTFTLRCASPGGATAASATVTVSQPPPVPTVALGATPSTINPGGSAQLAWSSANTTACTASGGWSGSRATSGTASTGALSGTTVFTLTCTGSGGSASQSTTVTVSAPLPTLQLTATPATVVRGSGATLTWSSTNATACTATGGWSGSRPTSGSEATGPLTTATTYSLACTGPGGSVTRTVTVAVTVPPPVVNLSASPATIASGQSSTLTWTTTDATACTASGGWSGSRSTSGSASTGSLAATTSYALACTGAGGSASQSTTVTVAAGAPVVTLAATPSTLIAGGATTLNWSATGATACTASGGWSGSRSTSGSFTTAALAATTTFTLTCTGDGGTATQSATVSVEPAAPTVTLAATPASVAAGAASTLAWSSTGADSCTASGGWSGPRATSGGEGTGNLVATTTYTLTCTGPGGSAAANATVTVTPPPPSVTLGASPSSVASGNTTTLTWASTNTTTCTASGAWSGARATSGSTTSAPLTANSSFTLTCDGPGGQAAQTTTVTVTAAPPTVSLTASPATLPAGSAATLTWSSSGATGCTASGGWSGSRATSGSESTGALAANTGYTLACTGAGGTTSRTVTITVVPAAAGRYPLRVEAGKRYLLDAHGQPFFMQGDAAWSLIVGLTREEAVTYLENRRQKGYNAILVNLIESYFASNPPRNRYGDAPFLVAGDYSTPNEAYFAHAEYVIEQAAARGILVVLTPSYAGYNGGQEGWYQTMVANGTDKLAAYGRYVANRFLAHDNILWLQGGDYNVPSKSLPRAIADGIRSVDTRWLQTYHGSRGTAALEFLGSAETWLTVNNIYTTHTTVVAEAQGEYNRSSMPAFLLEARYESGSYPALITRTQAWQAALSGMSGHIAGEEQLWRFASGWQNSLNSTAAGQLVHLRTLFESRPWATLVPDFAGSLLTAGIGSGSTRAAAARAADGSFAIVYAPTNRDLVVTLGQLAGGSVTARWYDPTSGAFTAVAGSPFPASGSQTFRPATTNAGGSTDWALLLEATP